MLLAFCDASILDGSMGLGVMVCKASYQGERIKVDAIDYLYKRVVPDIGEHEKHHYEFYSILEGLNVLKAMPQEETIIFNDCTNTVELLERLGSPKGSKKFKDRDFFIESMGTSSFEHIRFQWLPRGNKGIHMADKLSKTFYSYMGDKMTLADFERLENELKSVHFYKESFAESLMQHNLMNKWIKC